MPVGPNYFTLLLFIWIPIFYIIYGYNWKLASWKKRRNIALGFLICCTALLTPFCFWGMYNLTGIENGGLFFFSNQEDRVLLLPQSSYKSEMISNRYAIETFDVTLMTYDEVEFYFLDENFPEARYEEHNSSNWDFYSQGGTPPYFTHTFQLPYYYSEYGVVANWTMNVFNPSLNTTAVVSIQLTSWTFGESSRIDLNRLPFILMCTLWADALVVTLIANENYRKEKNRSSQTPARRMSTPARRMSFGSLLVETALSSYFVLSGISISFILYQGINSGILQFPVIVGIVVAVFIDIFILDRFLAMRRDLILPNKPPKEHDSADSGI